METTNYGDNCSTDNSDKVVESFLNDKWIQYYKNIINSGAAISRNYALIVFLDSDDLWLLEKLSNQIHFMKKNNYHFSCTIFEEIDSEGSKTGNNCYRTKED